MAGAWDYDLAASRVAVGEAGPVGPCMLARRGEDGWIGGVGVSLPARRTGVGEELMRAALAEARALGLRRVWLEVLIQNEPAIRLYEKLGFARVRDLEVWALPGAPAHSLLGYAGTAHAWIRGHRTTREPWQRADRTIANLSELDGLVHDEGAAVVRCTGGRASILQLAAGSDDALEALLEAARGLGESVSFLNLPTDDPAAAILERLGGLIDARQHELVLEL